MNRFNIEELKALRKSAAALNKSDYEITKRLENAYDHILLMLEALHDQNSNQTLMDIDDGIEILLERLVDTQLILRLVLRERELENKLAALDSEKLKWAVEAKETKHEILEKIKVGEKAFEEDFEGEDYTPITSPDILKKIEQRQQLESLIDSLYTSPEAERIKRMLARMGELRPIKESLSTNTTRPHRDLDASIPTTKGQGYKLLKPPEPTPVLVPE